MPSTSASLYVFFHVGGYKYKDPYVFTSTNHPTYLIICNKFRCFISLIKRQNYGRLGRVPCPRFLSVSLWVVCTTQAVDLRTVVVHVVFPWDARVRASVLVCLSARAWLAPVMASFAGDPRSPTAGMQVTEYNVDEDAELERIRMSIARGPPDYALA